MCALLQEVEAPWLCLRDLFQDGRLAGSGAAACGNPALGRGLTHLGTHKAHLHAHHDLYIASPETIA